MKPPIPPDFASLDQARSRVYDLDPHDTLQRVIGFLQAGRLVAWLVDTSGQLREIPVEYWGAEWAQKALINDQICEIRPGYVAERPIGRPVFRMDHLDEVLPKKERQRFVRKELAPVPASPVAGNSGGRPPKAGVDDFWIEICRKFHAGEAGANGQTQDQLVTEMLAWMSTNKPGLYEDGTVRDKVKAVWRALGITAARRKGV